MPDRATITEFLADRDIGFVGVSRDPKGFGNAVFRELRQRGWRPVPVHPELAEAEGVPTVASVAELPDTVRGVIIMVAADAAAGVVDECAARGIERVWLHKGAGPSSVTPEAVARAREAGMMVVDGACPLMWAEPVGGIHKLHRFFAKRRIPVTAAA
ncbi:MAG TPA: CoA-binding protein [Acidimicrobiales bacterium]|nr:CoA-binding protein [Acidimicrobiales bacterium]